MKQKKPKLTLIDHIELIDIEFEQDGLMISKDLKPHINSLKGDLNEEED